MQALRAIAILAVVLNHLWPMRLTGGYIGVDVFFVISGFLITSHLVRDATSSGRIALASFYARRVRRLLPAALLVLLVSAVGTLLVLPYPRWTRGGAEIMASAGYVENWFLAAMSVDYSALNDQATVAQHYWSLSVEEQFYLVWPLLLLATWWWAAKKAWRPRLVAAITLSVVVTLGIAISMFATAGMPSQAYFVTYTRAWEFGIGGLLSLVTFRRLPRLAANVVAIIGFVVIAVSAVAFGPETPFPGAYALLPVLGAGAVIAAGTVTQRLWHSRLTSLRPVQWLGDVSYSLYLWHWPLIVLVPSALASTMTTMMKVGILGVAFVLAWLTYRLVERPGQRWRLVAASNRRTFLAMLAGMATVIVAGGALMLAGNVRAAADVPPISVTIQECVGPQAMPQSVSCEDRFAPAVETVMGPRNSYFHVPAECVARRDLLPFGDKTATVECDFSDGTEDPTTVWLVGDSHAQQWQGTVFDLARQNHWSVTASFGGGCPVIDVPFVGFRKAAPGADQQKCRDWSTAVRAAVVEQKPDFVLTSSAGRVQLVEDGSGRPQDVQFADGLVRTWTEWADAGITVIPLGGVPFNGEVRSPDCVVVNAGNPGACAVPRSEAQPSDPYLVAAAQSASPAIRAFDADPYFCDSDACYAVIGGVSVYYDADHLNLDYVRRLAPPLAQAMGVAG
ncbi:MULTISPECIES: acyltransferase family protein [unclassified Microbacterium]|uniref:acyltransferase family protein n=1 Tax=unclassified Microbacterium TaxID=2609290 RepID=UPI001D144469|nr:MULTISPECIES: acyltransferase family protein [unclassified Microbacterium]